MPSWKRLRRSPADVLPTATTALLAVLVLLAVLAPLTANAAAAQDRPGGLIAARAATGGRHDRTCPTVTRHHSRPRTCAPQPCRSATHPRPVVLVHGTFGNSVDNWLVLAPYLVARGYCVYALDYGQLPGVPGINGLGPVDESAGQLRDFVDRVLAATGASEADIVGHSQGGMMPRYYLKFLGGAAKVHTLVGLAPDNHGTTLNGLSGLLTAFPQASRWLTEQTPSVRDQLAGSAFLTKLNAGGDTVPGVHYTVLTSKYDTVATPYRSQFLDGPEVHNVLLQDLCPLDLSGHVAVGTTDFVAFHEVANALDPAHATPTTCLAS